MSFDNNYQISNYCAEFEAIKLQTTVEESIIPHQNNAINATDFINVVYYSPNISPSMLASLFSSYQLNFQLISIEKAVYFYTQQRVIVYAFVIIDNAMEIGLYHEIFQYIQANSFITNWVCFQSNIEKVLNKTTFLEIAKKTQDITTIPLILLETHTKLPYIQHILTQKKETFAFSLLTQKAKLKQLTFYNLSNHIKMLSSLKNELEGEKKYLIQYHLNFFKPHTGYLSEYKKKISDIVLQRQQFGRNLISTIDEVWFSTYLDKLKIILSAHVENIHEYLSTLRFEQNLKLTNMYQILKTHYYLSTIPEKQVSFLPLNIDNTVYDSILKNPYQGTMPYISFGSKLARGISSGRSIIFISMSLITGLAGGKNSLEHIKQYIPLPEYVFTYLPYVLPVLLLLFVIIGIVNNFKESSQDYALKEKQDIVRAIEFVEKQTDAISNYFKQEVEKHITHYFELLQQEVKLMSDKVTSIEGHARLSLSEEKASLETEIKNTQSKYDINDRLLQKSILLKDNVAKLIKELQIKTLSSFNN